MDGGKGRVETGGTSSRIIFTIGSPQYKTANIIKYSGNGNPKAASLCGGPCGVAEMCTLGTHGAYFGHIRYRN